MQILGNDAWREFRGIPGEKGINDSSHLAKVEDSSGRLHSCFVKLLNPGCPALICEAIGWILAKNSGTPTVSFAAITPIPKEKLKGKVPLPDWTENFDFCPAWCSEIVDGKSVKQIYTWKFFTGRLACLKSKTTRQIAALDVWTDNKDRNYGNVIKSKSNEYIAIDHETLLHDLLWLPMGICYSERSLLKEAEAHLGPKEHEAFVSDVVGYGEGHKNAFNNSKSQIENLINTLYPGNTSLSDAVISHLDTRSDKDWINNQLGLMI
ncbi:hypothetical protein SAMN05216203_1492 [Marinobacter daqiaonensis]|uniref:Phosphatidylinositol 3-and 4-kinase n=1 Tax=Marinobacter daqiaonensis TaxID=650891 RepID=A0A1I6HSL9_9GAMM|nr:HipA family kinase [Marinobacter daqiaonensis]SFR57397.1 hypothetical protein SAMN05216203_1492 [Marinobacter daqiaonensis]